jgi:hypothetical protein
MKKIILLLILIVIGSIILYFANDDFKSRVNVIAKNIFGSPDIISSGESDIDKYGLLASDYDKNGWAITNGKWVSNPRGGTTVRYRKSYVTATSSKKITNTVIQNNSGAKPYRNFSSIEEIYPILRRVARDLEYSDIQALQESHSRYSPLPENHYYAVDGKKFYTQQDLFNYQIQQAKSWGSKNDQNNDGEINCMDYAELFYKYTLNEGYHVRYMSNDNLNHAFNGVNVNGSWITIEPQAAESGLDRSPLVSKRFPNYNPAYDIIKKQM